MDLGWTLGVSGWIWGGSGVDLEWIWSGSGVDLGGSGVDLEGIWVDLEWVWSGQWWSGHGGVAKIWCGGALRMPSKHQK